MAQECHGRLSQYRLNKRYIVRHSGNDLTDPPVIEEEGRKAQQAPLQVDAQVGHHTLADAGQEIGFDKVKAGLDNEQAEESQRDLI